MNDTDGQIKRPVYSWDVLPLTDFDFLSFLSVPHHFALLPSLDAATVDPANRTVDDFSSLITYTPASNVTHLDTTGFDVTKLYNGTIAVMNSTDTVNMTLKFTGTAIWLFTAKPDTTKSDSNVFGTGWTIFLDDKDVDDEFSADANTDAEYAQLAFMKQELPLGPHVITLASDGVVYFDHAIFTSNDPTPETTIPPVQAPPSSASSATQAKNTAHPAGASASNSGVPARKATSHIAVIAGAVAAVVLLLGAGVALLLVCRRKTGRRNANLPQNNYASGDGPYGATGQPGYGVNTSEAGLLRAPTLTAVSSQQYGSPSPPVPLPYPDAHNPYQFYYQDPAHGQPHSYVPHQQQYPEQQYTASQQQPYGPHFVAPIQPEAHHDPPQQYHQAQHQSRLQEPQQPQQYQNDAQHSPQDPFAYVQPHDAAMQRVMAEQRAVQAEYAPPTAWVVDEKRRGASPAQSPTSPQAQQQYLAPAPSPGALSPAPSWSTSSSSHVYSPTSPDTSRGHADPALSTIASEMSALRAQVARLEGERGPGPSGRESLPPPAYD
ncbi:hypothetical protein C8R47DRAFT_1329792 [Mycena vitilis]|nr:hypothetical protein C8R47DRAFT_1329792 [Mycena vitilis]